MGDRPIGRRRRAVSFIPPPQPDGTRLSEDTHWPYQFGAGIPPPFHPGDHAARTRESLRRAYACWLSATAAQRPEPGEEGLGYWLRPDVQGSWLHFRDGYLAGAEGAGGEDLDDYEAFWARVLPDPAAHGFKRVEDQWGDALFLQRRESSPAEIRAALESERQAALAYLKKVESELAEPDLIEGGKDPTAEGEDG